MADRILPCCNTRDIDDGERRRTLLALLAGLGLGDTVLAQDAAVVQPRTYRVAFENDKLRVLDFNSRPGMAVCGEGMHSHPAHLTIALSAVKVRLKLPDGKTAVGEAKFGDMVWHEAETHEIENAFGKDIRLLLIELKPAGGAKKA
jgi:hypothetical protein